MKSIIKTITTLLVVVITFTSAEFANATSIPSDTLDTIQAPVTSTIDNERMEKVLLFGLNSDVNGVVEATLFNAVAYKTLNPEFESSDVLNAVTRIALDEGNHLVRYKAYLTLSYMRDMESFQGNQEFLESVNSSDANAAFEQIVDSIRERQIVESRD